MCTFVHKSLQCVSADSCFGTTVAVQFTVLRELGIPLSYHTLFFFSKILFLFLLPVIFGLSFFTIFSTAPQSLSMAHLIKCDFWLLYLYL